MFSQQNFSISSQRRLSSKHRLLAFVVGAIVGLIFILSVFSFSYFTGNHISNCKNPSIYPMYFANDTFDKNTLASFCYQKQQFVVKWKINDSEIISQYQNCHDPIYQKDSVGLILRSSLQRYVNNYYTFIISPNGLIYSEDFSPYYKIHTHIFDCGQIKANVRRTSKGWQAEMNIPINKIGKGSIFGTQTINFFRIDVSFKQQKSISFNDKSQLQAIKKYIVQQNLKNQQKNNYKMIHNQS